MEINRHAPATAQGELQIAADPQTVFAVISASDQWPSWNPDVKSVTAEGPVQPGTVFRWKAGPSSLTSTLQVVDPPHQIAWTGTTMGIKAVHVFRFQATDDGTLGGVLGGPDRQSAQGLQPQDPGQGDPQRPVAPQGRGRTARRDGLSGATLPSGAPGRRQTPGP
jgi:uncharacterized protein YndB with AHSA1/START domain